VPSDSCAEGGGGCCYEPGAGSEVGRGGVGGHVWDGSLVSLLGVGVGEEG